MALPVDVQSLDALREIRAALVEFQEDVQNSLGTMELEIRRLRDWLEHDQKFYWQNQIKERERDMVDARSGLHRKRLSAMTGGEVHASEQKELLRQAKGRLEKAEDQLQRLRRWIPQLERAVGDYQGAATSMADMLSGDLDRGMRSLDRMIEALEEYVRLAPPETKAAVPSAPSRVPGAMTRPLDPEPTSATTPATDSPAADTGEDAP
jgi:DNA repair exonuclease SbcCD ATPase subunit